MKSFKQFVLEMLKPSEYRPLVKGWDKTKLDKIFKSSPLEKDRKAYRLFMPLSPDIVPSDIKKAVDKALQGKSYIPLTNQDYIDGVIRIPNKNNVLKIGKVLSQAKEDLLVKKFQEDPARKKKVDPNKNVTAIISRHPYDIARMSTRQKWSSCLDLEYGEYCYFVPRDIKAGTLVVYIVPNEIINNPRQIDKLSDQSAIGRVLIKPFINVKGETAYALESKTYNKFTANWHSTISNWVNNWLNKQLNVKGIFTLHPNVYDDSFNFDSKIAISTDENEQEQIQMVQENPQNIKKIKNPTETVQLIAIGHDVSNLQFIENPTDKVQITAIKQQPSALQYIKKPSEAVQLFAVSQNGSAIVYLIKNSNIIPSEAVQIAAVKKSDFAIQHIENPSENVQIAAINKNAKIIHEIKKPTPKAIALAISKGIKLTK